MDIQVGDLFRNPASKEQIFIVVDIVESKQMVYYMDIKFYGSTMRPMYMQKGSFLYSKVKVA